MKSTVHIFNYHSSLLCRLKPNLSSLWPADADILLFVKLTFGSHASTRYQTKPLIIQNLGGSSGSLSMLKMAYFGAISQTKRGREEKGYTPRIFIQTSPPSILRNKCNSKTLAVVVLMSRTHIARHIILYIYQKLADSKLLVSKLLQLPHYHRLYPEA